MILSPFCLFGITYIFGQANQPRSIYSVQRLESRRERKSKLTLCFMNVQKCVKCEVQSFFHGEGVEEPKFLKEHVYLLVMVKTVGILLIRSISVCVNLLYERHVYKACILVNEPFLERVDGSSNWIILDNELLLFMLPWTSYKHKYIRYQSCL